MACTLGKTNIESAGGGKGQQVGPPAWGYDNPYFHDWFYLPGPITPAGVRPGEIVFLRLGSIGEMVLIMQKVLNKDYSVFSHLEEDGDFGAQTECAVMEFQHVMGLVVDGIGTSHADQARGCRPGSTTPNGTNDPAPAAVSLPRVTLRALSVLRLPRAGIDDQVSLDVTPEEVAICQHRQLI
jgi:peptidoglycan hydrolase-like protein with peptidoglycan-binding domain